jgi:hypothetical protein
MPVTPTYCARRSTAASVSTACSRGGWSRGRAPLRDPLLRNAAAHDAGRLDRHIVGRVLRRSLRLVGALRLKFCSASDEHSAPLIWPVNRCTDVPRGREPAVAAVRPIRRSGAGPSTRRPARMFS